MTKTQWKKHLFALIDKATDLTGELRDAAYEIQSEAESIEPYEGKNDLTPQQEAKVEWLESLAEAMDGIADSIEELDSLYHEE